jgi:hypothetical protein
MSVESFFDGGERLAMNFDFEENFLQGNRWWLEDGKY